MLVHAGIEIPDRVVGALDWRPTARRGRSITNVSSATTRAELIYQVLQETPWVTGNPPIRETAGPHGANRPEPE